MHDSSTPKIGMIVLFCSMPAVSKAQETASDIRLADLTYNVRYTLGLEPVTLGAIGVTGPAYDSLALKASNYCAANKGTILPLMLDLRAAMAGFLRTAKVGEDLSADRGAMQAKLQALASACAPLFDEILEALPGSAQSALSATPVNVGIDPLLRLLSLSNQQRAQILAVQFQRDATTQNPMRIHRRWAVSRAVSAFDAAIDQILTPSQKTQLADFENAAEANLVAVSARELAANQLANSQASAFQISSRNQLLSNIGWLQRLAKVVWPAIQQWLLQEARLRAPRAAAQRPNGPDDQRASFYSAQDGASRAESF